MAESIPPECASPRSGAAWGRGLYEPDHGQFDKAEEIFGACGGAALYRKAMLDQIGLFDEDFFAYHEDVDLAFRARLFGWKCMYVPVRESCSYAWWDFPDSIRISPSTTEPEHGLVCCEKFSGEDADCLFTLDTVERISGLYHII